MVGRINAPYDHRERPHQGRGNETLDVAPRSTEGELRCSERLGGLLKHYARAVEALVELE